MAKKRLKKYFPNTDFWPSIPDQVQIVDSVLELDWSGNQGWKVFPDRKPKVTNTKLFMVFEYTM